MTHPSKQAGFTLLLALLIGSVVMAVFFSVLAITLKEYVFSDIGRESEIAFYAADAGMECALYWDTLSEAQGGSKFTIDMDEDDWNNIQCMSSSGPQDTNVVTPTQKHTIFTFEEQWANVNGKTLCASITLDKYIGPN